jgi:exodeoxyribonuclease VII large subunit
VLIYPTPVQGAEAPARIRRALALAIQRNECDVLVLGRGGGSLEDLWAFNDEALVRAVADSPIPVVSAVGHEVDVSLCDFAADVRAPTPSAAAELISPDGDALLARLGVLGRRQRHLMVQNLRGQRQRLEGLARRLHARHPNRQLEQTRQQVDELQARMARTLSHRLALLRGRWQPLDVRLRQQSPASQVARQAQRLHELQRRLPVPLRHQQRHLAQRLDGAARRLHTASPLATLDRGYSLTLVEGQPLRSVDSLKEGQTVETRLAKGAFEATVTRIKPEE